MRHGENARDVIERVRERLRELAPSLPAGVRVVTTYDRSDLIERAIDTLRHELVLQMVIVSLVILLFLWHIPSAIVPILTIPISVLLAFIPMWLLGISSNIMSLAGIAISIGVLVDGAIVEVENAYKKLELWEAGGRQGDYHAVRLEALMEVGPSVFFSLLLIAVAFIPVFTLVDQEGRLFRPLAWTKTFTMLMASLLALTLDPALRMLFTRMDWVQFRPRWLSDLWNQLTVGRYYPEERHPVSRVLFALYEPACRLVLRWPKTTIALALVLMLASVPAYLQLGHEFMPPLNEGTILYMPTTLPGISVTEASRLLQLQDRILKQFPEVVSVHGKAGRAETSTDPAPFSMMETVVQLKPDTEWRAKPRWYSSWAPEWLKDAVLQPDLVRPHQLGRAGRRDGPGTAHAGPDERLDHADQGPHRHADDRRAHAGRDQGLRGRPRGSRARRLRDRVRAARPSRARAAPSPSAWPAATSWTSTCGATRSRATASRSRRVQDVIMSAIGGENVTHDGRGPRALPGERALPARPARRHRDAPPRAGDDALGGAGPARPARRRALAHRSLDDPERERAAGRLRLRRHRRPRPGRLRRGRQEGGRERR